MSRRTMNFLLPTPGAGLNKKRKRFDDDVDYDGNGDGDGDGNDHAVHAVHDDHVRQSAAAAGAAGAAGAPTAKTNGDRLSPNNSKADADDANPNDDDDDDDGEAASFDPPPMEPQQQQQQQEEEGAMVVSDATSRLIEAMQFQIHTLTEKVARLDSLERRCRYLEEHCTCRTGGNGASRDDDDYGGGGSTAGNADAAEVPTLALLKSMEIPLNNLRQATDGIPSLERRYDDLEDLRRGMRGGDDRHPDYDRHHHNHHHHHHHHLRLQSLEERCRFLEAKLHAHAHALADVPSTIPPPSGKRPEDAATDADILFALLPDASPSDRPRPSALYDLDIVRAREEAVLLTIDTYKRRKRWPLRRNKADIFERDEKLTRLRLFESRRLRHEKVKFDKARDEGKEEEEEEEVEEEQEDQEQDQDQGQDQDEGDEEKKGGETTEGKNQMENKTRMSCKKNKNDSIDGETSNNVNVNVNVHINADILKFKSKSKSKSNEPKEKVNKQGIKSCALCASQKCSRKVRWKCGLCQVPLCTKKNKNGSKSCWEIWHTEMDWREERRRVQKELVEKRAKKRGVGRGRGGGVVENRGGDGEEDSDGEEEEEEEEDEVEEKGVEGGKEKENGRDGESVVHV